VQSLAKFKDLFPQIAVGSVTGKTSCATITKGSIPGQPGPTWCIFREEDQLKELMYHYDFFGRKFYTFVINKLTINSTSQQS